MVESRLAWRLTGATLAVTAGAVAVLAWTALYVLQQMYLDAARRELEVRAGLLAPQIRNKLSPAELDEVREICRRFGRSADTRITLVLAGGEVVVDTDEDPGAMENHGDRPEFRDALAGRPGMTERYSTTIRQKLTYVAVPLERGGRVVGALRMAIPAATIDRALGGVKRQVVGAAAAIVAVSAVMAWLAARRTSRQIEAIGDGAARFAQGDLADRVPAPSTVELARLVDSLNRMAHQLRERIRTTDRQSTEQEAVLASMTEGVLAIDPEERLISLNQAAADLLGCRPQEAQGKALAEVVRNPDLRRFLASALAGDEPVQGDLVLAADRDRVLQAHGTALRDAAGHTMGAVIVLNDVTRLRRLESLRRDFVANVSHELKTPITSIKGFVETLLDGAVKDPQDAERFLRIIARQAERLDHIIEDLLSLSKIEQGEQARDIELARGALRPVLEEAIAQVQPLAGERRIGLNLACAAETEAEINGALLAQAVMNLLDNAVKHSEAGSEVEVAAAADGQVTISVRDEGCGIAPEHVPRLFERFYRVDKARSRKLGGTGLGLAIVKHIVQAHRGTITVESAPGRGSTFTIHLPR
jgi:two-component system phosphate regulon sensor histidine kinase PhoR